MKFAVAALLGLVSGELVQCPFGHYHEHDPNHKTFGQKQFGIPTNETREIQEYDDEHEHHECPFKKAVYKFKNGVKDSYKRNTEHHDSPFYDPEAVEETETWVDEALAGNGVPTAFFHGFGDACINPGDIQFDREIAKGTGAKVHCIEVGVPSLGEVFNNFEHVAEESCKKVAANPDFAGEFNVVGLSQGGLLARYIVEECEMPGKVRNMLTAGGPHMGVAAIPGCFEGTLCSILNFFASKIVYFSWAQNIFAPAGYFRDVKQYNRYVADSTFLPAINNEQKENWFTNHNELRSKKFSDLNGAMLVMFDADTVIYPKETAWFQSLDEKGNVLPLNGTDFYNDDYIGVKALNEAGKIQFVSLPGDHLQFTTDDIKNTFIPFLNQ